MMKMKSKLLTILFLITACLTYAQGPANYYNVEARTNADDTVWRTYQSRTISKLPGFKKAKEPALDQYGGWMINKSEATGFFRTEKRGDRWWIIDPDGYPFIHRGIAVFRAGESERQQAALVRKFQTQEIWAAKESDRLRSDGFNGLGAWSDVDKVRALKNPLVYTVIVNPMGAYKSAHQKKYGGQYLVAGWQGYRFDLAMVFDPQFGQFVDEAVKEIAKYANDKYLLGYYTDNELPWKNDALDRHLKFLAHDEPGYLAAKKWLDDRKQKDASLADITPEDRLAFSAFYFETYIKKVTSAIRKYDPNHLYLGCRFNQEREELANPAIFEVAGKYMDVISINHYRKWEPDQNIMKKWKEWSGKPFLITEWYTKGEDSGLPNRTGAGWNVHTQKDRGYFYQNFVIGLIESKACVGWHWFTYQDNDPENLKTDYSNRDSNKGIVDSEYNVYKPLTELMGELNHNLYNLIEYMDKK
jgi:hypothetical protein